MNILLNRLLAVINEKESSSIEYYIAYSFLQNLFKISQFTIGETARLCNVSKSTKMEETGALIGGESSGGLTIASHIKGKDGIFAAALLIEIMAKTEKTLSALKQEMDDRFGSFYTDERSFRFTPEGKRKLEKEIFDRTHLPVFPCNERKLSWEDGCKVYFDTGWLLIRFSGTEPLLRLFCEMQDKVQAQRINDLVEEYYSLRKMEAYR